MANSAPSVLKRLQRSVVQKVSRRPTNKRVVNGPDLDAHVAQPIRHVESDGFSGELWRQAEGENLECKFFDRDGRRIPVHLERTIRLRPHK